MITGARQVDKGAGKSDRVYARIAAIRGCTPSIWIVRFRLYASTCRLSSVVLGAEDRGFTLFDIEPILAERIDDVRIVRNENRVGARGRCGAQHSSRGALARRLFSFGETTSPPSDRERSRQTRDYRVGNADACWLGRSVIKLAAAVFWLRVRAPGTFACALP